MLTFSWILGYEFLRGTGVLSDQIDITVQVTMHLEEKEDINIIKFSMKIISCLRFINDIHYIRVHAECHLVFVVEERFGKSRLCRVSC